MNTEVDDQMVLDSQYYPPGINYNNHQFVPQQGPTESERPKPRRRRKKNKNDQNGTEGGLMRKRKLSDEQVHMLEQSFGDEHKLESERKDKLASELGLDPRQVAVWFQNRRARWKSKKLEEEYARLKSVHETTVVEKCRLETELLKLKEQVDEARREIHRLNGRSSGDGFSSINSTPCSSFSIGPSSFLGMNELNHVVNYDMPENYQYVVDGLDQWGNYIYNYM